MSSRVQKTAAGSAVENGAAVSPEQLSLLKEDLGHLRDVGADLPDSALNYVLSGAEPDVLPRLSGTKGAGAGLWLTGCPQPSGSAPDERRTARARFFQEAADLEDARLLLRLAEVYDAAARPDRGAHWKSPLGLPDWLGLFLFEVTGTAPNIYSNRQAPSPLRAEVVERMAEAAGLGTEAPLRAVLFADPRDYSTRYRTNLVTSLAGFARAAGRHPQAIREALGQREADRRVHVLELMASTEIDPAPFADRLAELAVGSSKTVRQAAEALLVKVPAAAVVGPHVRARVESGSNDERVLAAQLLWRLEGEAAREFLRGRQEKESAAKVKAAVAELLAEQAAGAETAQTIDLPAVPAPDLHAPLSPAARAAFAAVWHESWEADKRHCEKYPNHNRLGPAPTDADIDGAAKLLETMGPGERQALPMLTRPGFVMEPAKRFAAHPDVRLLHLVRLAELMSTENAYWRQSLVAELVVRFYHTHPPGFSLRDLAAALQAVGRGADDVNTIVFANPWGGSPLLGLAPEHVWPYYAEHPDLLESAWREKAQYSFQVEPRRRMVFKILAMFPTLPPSFVRMCWDIAFNGTRKERPLAQAALASVPDKEQRILAALTAGKADHRAIAAEWLGRLKDPQAVPALKKALAKEKQDAAAGAEMAALEALGVPLEEFVSTDGLRKEAEALLAKGIPEDLAWFGFDLLPKVRWADTGRPVPGEVLRWMIVQSHKLGSPEPGPRLRQYTKRLDRRDAENLGQYVLESWIARDTIPHTHEQAHEHAERTAAQMAQRAQHSSQYYTGTREEWYRNAYNSKINEPVGSASGEKGILAVAGACCGGRAAAPVERYLKTYYGYRVHQCKALIRMLSWVEHPSAIQVLLSVANRFRTAGIRKEAERVVQALAERKDWTVDELADRSIPTGGFDPGAGLVLDYGPRRFTAALDADLNVVLTNEEGKTIKALPSPRQEDDAEKAKAAKKQLSAAKKEIESVLKLQRERLYEAMCTQRSWRFADWDQFLNRHPVLRTYCRRLVWGVAAEPANAGAAGEFGESTDSRPRVVSLRRTFRPLEDGSLTDTNDDAVEVGPDERVVLAHDSNTDAETAKAWLQHMADYDVRPLFEQFGKGGYQLPEAKRAESAVTDFRGHLLEAFRLRGRLTKLGYTRGPAGDGGWFTTYHKHFPSLSIKATVEFTGSPLPEENRTVALLELYFERTQAGERESSYSWSNSANRLSLGEVPPVLLSECHNDLRQAAAEGTGFDPEWEKKSQY